MIEGGFRHLLVVNGAELEGILSMRDIVRCWTGDRVPRLSALASAAAARDCGYRSRRQAVDLAAARADPAHDARAR